MSSILSFCQAMLPYVLGAAPIVILLRVVRIRQLHRLARSTTWQHEVGTGLFFLFLAGLASVTVLPQRNAMGHFQLDWHTGLARVNLVPFRIFADTLWGTDYFLINFWGNLAMFAPIGFFVPLLWRGHGLKSTSPDRLLQLAVCRAVPAAPGPGDGCGRSDPQHPGGRIGIFGICPAQAALSRLCSAVQALSASPPRFGY